MTLTRSISAPARSIVAGKRCIPIGVLRIIRSGSDLWIQKRVVDRRLVVADGDSVLAVSAPCGSRSTRSTLLPRRRSPTPMLKVVVVLPTPPFWLTTAVIESGPGGGSGGSESSEACV